MVLRGVNCHSPFKHYMMFHSGCEGGGNYGSIFNTTYNISCGGHGGFWSGVGYGVGNFLGGIINNFCGGSMWGGGMPWMNMWSGGNMWGGGMPWMNFWGGGGGGSVSDTSSSSCKCGCKDKSSTSGVYDADNILIENFRKEIDNLKTDASEILQKGLYDRIKAKLDKPEDSVYEKQNKEAYENLLRSLKEKFPKTDFDGKGNDDGVDGTGNGDDNDEGVNGTGNGDGNDEGVNGTGNGNGNDDGVNGTGNGDGSNGTVKVGGKEVKISELTDTQIKGLTPAEIEALTKKQAGDILNKFGIEDGGIAKGTNCHSILLLLEKSEFDVKLAENSHSSAVDHWIQGKIQNVSKDPKAKISYTVDCTAHGTQKNIYSFEQKDKDSNTYTVTIKTFGSGIKYAKAGVTSVDYTFDTSKDYLWRDGYKFTTAL